MKIYILGSVASGKTTVAKKLSKKLGLPCYTTDDFVWERHKSGDIRNLEITRNQKFNEIIRKDNWIIEGIHIGWTEEGMANADLILFLDVPYSTRTRRIFKRYFKQKLNMEEANYRPTIRIVGKMMQWNRLFEQVMKPEALKFLEEHKKKTRILKTEKEIERTIRQLEVYSTSKN
ncbi:MAG TPA: AAA family ATPase [Planococcus sp. (in: firmicutes)]|nr:AAA family ATPase [Planococcus sp. (in: firmicutes)]